MAKILIQYPPEYACYEKFSRKLGKICQNLEIEAVYFVADPTALIEKWLKERSEVEAIQIESGSVPVGEITHAVTFESADGLFVPLKVGDVPSRTIVVPITRVANKDRGEEFDVYIGRGTKWGNPYAVGFGQVPGEEADNREEAIRKYAYDFSRGLLGDKNFMTDLAKLQGKRLGCHCKPRACHGDVLAGYLNALDDGG